MLRKKQSTRELPLGARSIRGAQWGLQLAAVYAFFAVLARVVGGKEVFDGGPSLAQTLLAESTAGILGGLFLGLVVPWITSGFRTALVGLLVGAITGAAFSAADKGLARVSWADSYVLVAFALLGALVAVMGRRRAANLTSGEDGST